MENNFFSDFGAESGVYDEAYIPHPSYLSFPCLLTKSQKRIIIAPSYFVVLSIVKLNMKRHFFFLFFFSFSPLPAVESESNNTFYKYPRHFFVGIIVGSVFCLTLDYLRNYKTSEPPQNKKKKKSEKNLKKASSAIEEPETSVSEPIEQNQPQEETITQSSADEAFLTPPTSSAEPEENLTPFPASSPQELIQEASHPQTKASFSSWKLYLLLLFFLLILVSFWFYRRTSKKKPK